MKLRIISLASLAVMVFGFHSCARWDDGAPTVTVAADEVTSELNPLFYGLMTEEINYSYDGGLYAELIRNRAFDSPAIYYRPPVPINPVVSKQDEPMDEAGIRKIVRNPEQLDFLPGQIEMRLKNHNYQVYQENHVYYPDTDPNLQYQEGLYYWNPVMEGDAKVKIALDNIDQSSWTVMKNNARIEISNADGKSRAGIYNEGYWGIPVWPNTTYRASFYAKAAPGFDGPITVAIESNDGSTSYASATVSSIGTEWKKYELTLATADATVTDKARFTLTSTANGKFWISFVSLFPPTYNDRPNGLRKDLMELMAEMHPAFLRFPGGNYVQGHAPETRFEWKKMIGPVEMRPTHYNDSWHYHSSDGMGLMEFMDWCEDLGMEPILVVFSGMYLDTESGSPFLGKNLEPFIEEALEEIEFLTGDTDTKWGALRAQYGHPEPYKLKYIEIGNEDFHERRGNTYSLRYMQMYNVLKKAYPDMVYIASSRVIDDTVITDMVDVHQYMRVEQGALAENHRFDPENYPRTSPKIFVGEYATREGRPTTNLQGALYDASYLLGCERNSDLVEMTCFAPIFCNVNLGGVQWECNLMGYNAVSCYGAPSFYVQSMFSKNLGVHQLSSKMLNTPIDSETGFEDIIYNVTKDDEFIYVKAVNVTGKEYPFQVDIKGVGIVDSKAVVTVLKGDSDQETNSIDNPLNIVPQESVVNGFGKRFSYTLEPYSVNVIKLGYK